MWLVISEPNDDSGIWAYQKLKKIGLEPIELVTPEELSYLRGCEYEITSNGSRFEFDLYSRKKIKSESIRGILNRLLYVHTTHFINSEDAGYASEELNAFFIGWLGSLEVPILNKPLPYNFAGRDRHIAGWRYLAAKSGLRTLKFNSAEEYIPNLIPGTNGYEMTAIILDDTVVDVESALPSEIKQGCIKLGSLSETRLLQVFFSSMDKELLFSHATPFPELALGGNTIVDKIKDVLKGDNR
jgi:hypothetical protein